MMAKTKTAIDPIPAKRLDLSAQIEAVKADVRNAEAALATAEAGQIECAADDTAYASARAVVDSATIVLDEHRARQESLEKLDAKNAAAELAQLNAWLQRRADRILEWFEAERAAILEERRDSIERHAAEIAVLDWRDSAAQ